MKATRRGVSAYLKFRQEHSFTCHWLLIYSLESPILFLWYQFLLTVALLTTSVNESLYNYDCWWPMTQTWRGCHYMNIKVIHRDAGMEDQVAETLPPLLLWRLHLKQGLLLYGFIPQNNVITSALYQIEVHTTAVWVIADLCHDKDNKPCTTICMIVCMFVTYLFSMNDLSALIPYWCSLEYSHSCPATASTTFYLSS